MPVDFESIRPVISGLLGAAIAAYLTRRWYKSMPRRIGKRSRAEVLREHRLAIRTANTFGIAGLVGGLALYKFGVFTSHDWRGLGVVVGLAGTAPLIIMPLSAVIASRSIREAYHAYSLSQKTPFALLYSLLAMCAIFFAITLVSLWRNGI